MAYHTAHSYLVNFIQLIQIWAAICVLFFYQPFLEDSPLLDKLKELDKRFKKFISSHQDIFDKSNESYIYDPTKWSNFVPRIKNMAAITFFYCVFLLVYIGVEKSWGNFYPVTHPSFLLYSNILIILYVILCSIFDWKLFQQYRTPVVYIIVIFVLFLGYELFDKLISGIKGYVGLHLGHENTWFWITIITLFVCIIAMILLIIRIWANNYVVKQKVSTLQRLHRKFDVFENIIKEIIRVDSFYELSENSRVIVEPLLLIDNDLFKKEKKSIIKELGSTHFRRVTNQKIIDELSVKESYYDLENSTKKAVRPICVNRHLIKMDKSDLIKKISLSMRNDFLKEKFEEALFSIKKEKNESDNNESLKDQTETIEVDSPVNNAQPLKNDKPKKSDKSNKGRENQKRRTGNRRQYNKKKIRDILI